MLLLFLVYVSGLVSRYKLQSKFLYFSSCCETALFLFSESQLSCFSLYQCFPSLSLFLCLRYKQLQRVCVSPAPRQYVVRGRGGGADGDLVMKSGGDGFLLLQPPESDSHSLSSGSLSQQLCGGERRLDGFSRKILSIHLFFLSQAFPLKNVYISLSI